MNDWNKLHRESVIPYIRDSDKEERRIVNRLLSDMKSSLKWARFEECLNIYGKIKEIV